MKLKQSIQWIVAGVTLVTVAVAVTAFVSPSKNKKSEETAAAPPNILVIMGDDIGVANISAYSRGIMGYETPNIDRIANEGAILLHYYGEQSCTAGRAAFITGQHGI